MTEPEIVDHPDVAGGVVVGDDGSDGSRTAVRWAAQYAALCGSPLHVLRSWSIRTMSPPKTSPGYVPPLSAFEAAVRAEMEESWAGLSADEPGVEVHLQPVHGPAARVLLEASETAVLVVVGSRGRGGFVELVLGSTADQIVRHSRCPVTVVRPGRVADGDRSGTPS